MIAVPEQPPTTHDDLKYALGRLDAKVDILLSGQDRRDVVLKEVSDRLFKVEVEIIALQAEKKTTEKHHSNIWAFIVAVASLAISAVTAFVDKIPL